jgi:hypothetical protein
MSASALEERITFSINRHLVVIFGLIAACVIVLISIVLTYLYSRNSNSLEGISACVERFASRSKVDYKSFSELSNLNSLCYGLSGSQLFIDEEIIRRDNFVFQRFENAILLVMVVAITLSGVVLAGLQLFASYKLAIHGKGELASGGEISYSKDSISFKSSIVGLVILAVSFAFFLVFVFYVYDLKEGKDNSSPGMPKGSPQVSNFVPRSNPGTSSEPQQRAVPLPTQPSPTDNKPN